MAAEVFFPDRPCVNVLCRSAGFQPRWRMSDVNDLRLQNNGGQPAIQHRPERDPAWHRRTLLVRNLLRIHQLLSQKPEVTVIVVAAPRFKETMSNTVGHRTTELALQLGLLYSPAEALKVGLVDQLVPEDQVLATSLQTMTKWLAIPGSFAFFWFCFVLFCFCCDSAK